MDISSSSPSWSCCSLIRNTKDTGELSKLALLPCTLHWLGISLFLFLTSILRHNICHSVSTVWSPHTKINSNIFLWNEPFSELKFMYNFFHENITAFVTNNTCAKQGEFSFLKNITHRWSYIFSYNFIFSSTALLNMLVPSITSPTSNSSSNFLNFSTAALLSCWAIISLCGAPPEDDLGIVNVQLRKLKKSMKLCWLLRYMLRQFQLDSLPKEIWYKASTLCCQRRSARFQRQKVWRRLWRDPVFQWTNVGRMKNRERRPGKVFWCQCHSSQ